MVRDFRPNSDVMVRDFRPNSDKWIPGTVLSQLGPVTYTVEVEDGKTLKKHVDHIRERMSIAKDSAPAQSDTSEVQDNYQYPAVTPTPPPDAAIAEPRVATTISLLKIAIIITLCACLAALSQPEESVYT